MTAARRKGTAAATAVVSHFVERGNPNVERRALAGAKDRGDIAGLPGITIEVKNHKQHDLAGWLDQLRREMANDGTDIGAVIAKRRGTTYVGDWYCITPVDVFHQLLREAGRCA